MISTGFPKQMRQILPLVAAVAVSLSMAPRPVSAANAAGAKPGAQAVKPIAVRDKWAVLIGVNRYKDPILPPLKYAEKNVVDLSRMLIDPTIGRFPPDHVQSITGGGASRAKFNELVDTWLYKKALPGDMIVIYAASHVADDPKSKEAFLCLRDSMSTDPATGVPLVAFCKQLKQRTQASYVVLMLDTSYGGTSPSIDDSTLTALSNMGVSVFAASGIGGQSYEDAIVQNSYFASKLMEGLKAGGGLIPLVSLAGHIRDSVGNQVKATLHKTQKAVFVPASHLTDDMLPTIGIETRAGANSVANIGFGHPVDQLGLTRPDLVMPRAGGQTMVIPGPGAKPAVPQTHDDEDEDDDDKIDHSLDMRPYIAKMKGAIQQKWQPPKGLENRKVGVVFTIKSDGSIVSPQIVQSSGQADVDKTALDALKAASPLDPLPKGAPRSVDIKYQFDWNVTRGSAGGN